MFCFRIISYYMQDACHHHPSLPQFPFPPFSHFSDCFSFIFLFYFILFCCCCCCCPPLVLVLLYTYCIMYSYSVVYLPFPISPRSLCVVPCCVVMFSLLLVLFICSFNIHRKYIVCLFALVFYVICGKSCVLTHRVLQAICVIVPLPLPTSLALAHLYANFQQRHLSLFVYMVFSYFTFALLTFVYFTWFYYFVDVAFCRLFVVVVAVVCSLLLHHCYTFSLLHV